MIVNADDLGYRPHVTAGVVRALESGVANRATIMANMPDFEDACAVVRDRGLASRVGVHLVLTEGVPLSDELRREPRFCDGDGNFRPRSQGWARLTFTTSERALVAREVAAQVARCRENGLPITHLDSHHHVHIEPSVGYVVVRLAPSIGIRSIRIARNCGAGTGVRRSLYKSAYNLNLRLRGLAASRYFGGMDDLEYIRARWDSGASQGEFELMTHPVLRDDGVVIDVQAPGRSLEIALAELRSPAG